MSFKRRLRDFQRCVRNMKSFSDNQAKINKWDEDCLNWVEVLIRPSGGFYEGGTFRFKIYFEGDFPKCPPRVDCLTPIYHPNIDSTSADYNVCLNLFDEWDDKYSLEDIIQGLLFLLYNPNVEDPLSPYFTLNMSVEQLEEQIKQSLQGGDMDGATENFPENNCAEIFDDAELTKGIEFILQKASRMISREADEEKEAVKDEYQDQSDSLQNSDHEDDDDLPLYNVILHTESRSEKYDLVGRLRCAFQETECQWTVYIPRIFIPTQSDLLTEIALMFVATLTR